MNNQTILLITCSAFLLLGCKKYLEQAPDQRTQINTPEKVGKLLVTAYPSGNYMMFAEAMTDNVTDNYVEGRADAINTDSYFWNNVRSISRDSPTSYWNDAYKAIAVANHALRAIEEMGGGAEYMPWKGEALLARAYAHFMLVNLFSKSYDKDTAAEDLGIPYITQPETVVEQSYGRHTVEYVYEQIEKDLKAGLPLLKDDAYSVAPFHFTRRAAHAFATRFYLFWQKPESAIEHADLVFPDGNVVAKMRPWTGRYKNLSYNELAVEYTKATEPANLLLIETQSWWGSRWRDYRYSTSSVLRNQIFGLGGESNITGGALAYITGQVGLTSYYVRKFTYFFARIGGASGTTGYGYTVIPALTTEEVLFNRAEAYIMLERYDDALADINTFISQRVTGYNSSTHDLTLDKARSYYGVGDDGEALIKAILDLKRPEFIHEGMRWFDILRHRLSVVHKDLEGNTYTLSAGDPRRTLQLPQEALNDPGIQPNPR
ncbi:RagB/SusD family nutrient uptake outer membrane protein [Sphingobacterium sp. SGG-5]|uniref:RagB/SusD family nutrient uptake outer membrane protein n=1 Tax=Sphingobacterium sp. SGG-5 TaxID=2710881 RepID=UPI0013ED4AFC|nr:RagB/SusD family nutrient uptake outer membrane protein [Sphingobacterium sp. SGG-5]NGM62178.1 RagB/SusD family nutrient uptake outer membrane protein [Sphingobacterium sp. SGG-5]